MNHKWDKVLDAATRKEEHLFSQYLEESKAIVETLGKLDSEEDENQYKFHLAAFNRAQYNLAIDKGTDKEEQHAHNEQFYLSRINEYHEGSRPSTEKIEDLLGRLIKRKDELEQQQDDKELAVESSQQASEELKKQTETKPEQLSKEKQGTMENKPALPEQQMMPSGRHSFKPPKPRTYSGVGQDKDPEVFEQ